MRGCVSGNLVTESKGCNCDVIPVVKTTSVIVIGSFTSIFVLTNMIRLSKQNATANMMQPNPIKYLFFVYVQVLVLHFD
jgi:hypothetical protein